MVDRDREIAQFVPVPFWSLDVLLAANGQTFTAQWRPGRDITDDEGRCLDQRHAQAAQARFTAESTAIAIAIAIAISVETERVKEVAPLPFDLGTLQEICSKKLGLGAQETLNVAQALYETHKATTYPRTDCGYLPTSMLPEVPAVLEARPCT